MTFSSQPTLLFLFRTHSLVHVLVLADDDLLDCSVLISRLLVMGLSMTAADLCSSFKHWAVQRSNVSIIMEEFFQQVIVILLRRCLSLSHTLSLARSLSCSEYELLVRR